MNSSTFVKELHLKNLNNHKTVLADTRKVSPSSNSTHTILDIRNSRKNPENCVLNTTTIHIKQQQYLVRKSASGSTITNHGGVNVAADQDDARERNSYKTRQQQQEHNSFSIAKEKCNKIQQKSSIGSKETVANENFSKKSTLFPTLKPSDTDQHHLNHVLNIKISPALAETVKTSSGKINRNGEEVSKPILIENCVGDRKISVIKVNQDRNYNSFRQFCVNMVHNTENFDSDLSDSNNKISGNINSVGQKSLYKNLKDLKMSGQCSPTTSDHLDSGTCSDAELNLQSTSPQPPPLPKKMSIKHNILSDSICSNSDESVSSLSSDSLNFHQSALLSPELIKSLGNHQKKQEESEKSSLALFPSSLLKDIRNHSVKFALGERTHLTSHRSTDDDDGTDESEDCGVLDFEHDEFDIESNYSDCTLLKSPMLVNQVSNYEQNIKYSKSNENCNNKSNNTIINNSSDNNEFYENDKFYKFHINENLTSVLAEANQKDIDETFAGYKDFNNGTSTIRSSKGTVRGVKNRVRNGIATFLQMQQTTVKVSRMIFLSHIKFILNLEQPLLCIETFFFVCNLQVEGKFLVSNRIVGSWFFNISLCDSFFCGCRFHFLSKNIFINCFERICSQNEF